MKQRITKIQLREISDEQKEQLREWWNPQYGDAYYYPKVDSTGHVPSGYLGWELDDMKTRVLPLLSIGQMIEFLETKEYPTLHIDKIPVRGMMHYDRL
ncbi:hypothetical protein SD71_10710 [Cohnella kolymensis]|uniref:Uncharacterized protein n=1 Tax=Cohnella kolymensis TaxID=1590652 RepID=A0ABR5A4J8_9BACL|nr:hypothetical protein [Cohnella kolymensis]KIL35857.1 hypothetical protein SD71_10710 [Cohnella kolymensis]